VEVVLREAVEAPWAARSRHVGIRPGTAANRENRPVSRCSRVLQKTVKYPPQTLCAERAA
jgi:hypothetical protein